MLPLRDENPVSRVPVITIAIIALNLLAFLFWEPTFASGPTAPTRQETFFFCHSEIPWETLHRVNLAQGGGAAREAIDRAQIGVTGRELQDFLKERCPHKSWLLAVFTAMFLHAGWLHIGGNMLFLWIFGNNVEDKIGRLRYLIFYLAGGLAATVVQIAVEHSGTSAILPNLGASGAIAAVLGAYLFMFPRRRVLTLVFAFFITIVALPAWIVLAAWFVLQAFSGVAALSSQVHTGGVAFWAHIGGFAFGALLALAYFPKERFATRPPPRRPDAPKGLRRLSSRSGGRPWARRGRLGPPAPPLPGDDRST